MSKLNKKTAGRIRAEAGSKKDENQRRRQAKLRLAEGENNTNFRVAAAGNTVDVYLYDVIGWPYIEAADLLYQIPRGASKINVHLNTPGGDVCEGMAIYNMLVDHKAEIVVIVDGLAASSGSLIAMAGDTIQMAKASFFMIHNPWSMLSGDAAELRKEATLLDQISDVFAEAYATKMAIDYIALDDATVIRIV